MTLRAFYLLSVWIHIVAAAVWIGSLVFFGLALVPTLKDRDLAPIRALFLQRLGLRFRWVAWAMIGTLVVTGLVNLSFRGLIWSDLWNLQIWRSSWGQVLGWKLALVAALVVVHLLHDFYIGPRATRLLRKSPHSPEGHRAARAASWIGRIELLLSLAILGLAVLLVRGAL